MVSYGELVGLGFSYHFSIYMGVGSSWVSNSLLVSYAESLALGFSHHFSIHQLGSSWLYIWFHFMVSFANLVALGFP